MDRKNLNIWSIQKNPKIIDKVLGKLKRPGTNILYTNCMSKLVIGGKPFKVGFDKALYSEANDILILIARESKVTDEELIRKLERRNIPFNQITFAGDGVKDCGDDVKEVWFARDGSDLRSALGDSKRKGNDVCRYFPAMKGNLFLKYMSIGRRKSGWEVVEEPVSLDHEHCRGVVETDDKIILFVCRGEEHRVYHRQALSIFSKLGMIPEIDYTDTYEPVEKEKQKVKKL